MAIIKLKPLNKKDPIFNGLFMTFSNKRKKRRKNERQSKKTKSAEKKS